MKSIMKRLKNKAGETLVESMAAILIFTFGSLILLGMVSAAADINTAAKEADKAHTEQMVTVEKGEGEYKEKTVTFTYLQGQSGEKSETANVYMYGGDDKLYSYYPDIVTQTPAEGGGGTGE